MAWSKLSLSSVSTNSRSSTIGIPFTFAAAISFSATDPRPLATTLGAGMDPRSYCTATAVFLWFLRRGNPDSGLISSPHIQAKSRRHREGPRQKHRGPRQYITLGLEGPFHLAHQSLDPLGSLGPLGSVDL